MSDIYKRAIAGRLTLKSGDLAALKSIDKKKKKKKKQKEKEKEKHKKHQEEGDVEGCEEGAEAPSSSEIGGEAMVYTIDAAKKMKYEDLFPFESKKFGYDPANKSSSKNVEAALDDRVRKKADRYCK